MIIDNGTSLYFLYYSDIALENKHYLEKIAQRYGREYEEEHYVDK